MKYLKSYRIFESVGNIKSDLEDIFQEVTDRPGEGWFYSVDGDDLSGIVDVYISFGGVEPYNTDPDDDDESYISDYPEVQISQELIESLNRAIDYMTSLGWSTKIQLCEEYSSDPSEDSCEDLTMADLEVGQWMQENQALRLRFRKSIVKEELKTSTYASAANKLRNLGHIRRSTELQNWAKEAEEKRKREEELLRKTDISQFPPFRLQFYKGRWDSTQKRTIETLLVDGLFYIEPSFSSDWLGDMMWDHESDQCGLCLYIEFGTMPADEETQKKWNEIKGQISVDEWQGMAWTTRFSMPIFSENSFEIMTTGKCFWESVENENFVFSDRAEAIRFKKYFIEALEGKNLWGKNKWKPQGLKGQFDTFFQKDLDWREKERADGKERREQYFKPEHMTILVNRVKTGLSINDLYRN